jgi:hypothetical protein
MHATGWVRLAVVATRKNGVLSYLHGDRGPFGRGSMVATSNGSGNFSGQEWYHAYGRYRGEHELGTENRFTGKKFDAPSGFSGLWLSDRPVMAGQQPPAGR